MSPKSSGFVRPVETTSSRWDEATARFLSVFHQTPNTLKKSNGSAARKRTRSRANGRGLSARLESGRAQSAAGPRQKSAGQRPISSRIAHQRVLLRSAASNTSSTNRKIASAQASSRPPSGLRALSFLLVNHSRKPRTLVGGNWKNKGNVVKWSGLAPQSREISLDAPHKERLPIGMPYS